MHRRAQAAHPRLPESCRQARVFRDRQRALEHHFASGFGELRPNRRILRHLGHGDREPGIGHKVGERGHDRGVPSEARKTAENRGSWVSCSMVMLSRSAATSSGMTAAISGSPAICSMAAVSPGSPWMRGNCAAMSTSPAVSGRVTSPTGGAPAGSGATCTSRSTGAGPGGAGASRLTWPAVSGWLTPSRPGRAPAVCGSSPSSVGASPAGGVTIPVTSGSSRPWAIASAISETDASTGRESAARATASAMGEPSGRASPSNTAPGNLVCRRARWQRLGGLYNRFGDRRARPRIKVHVRPSQADPWHIRQRGRRIDDGVCDLRPLDPKRAEAGLGNLRRRRVHRQAVGRGGNRIGDPRSLWGWDVKPANRLHHFRNWGNDVLGARIRGRLRHRRGRPDRTIRRRIQVLRYQRPPAFDLLRDMIVESPVAGGEPSWAPRP